MITLPGLVDVHTHLRTPGQTHKEDFYTGTCAAAAGGFTQIIDMPNNTIPITSDVLLDGKIKMATEDAVIDVGFHFGSLGDNLEEFENVKKKVFGLKLYLNETTGNFLIDTETLSRIFKAWPSPPAGGAGPILVHAEDDAVSEVIKNVAVTKKHAHFCHISLQTDLEQIMAAKEKGLPVSCGVTPHHLFLTQEDAKKLGPYGKMKPYLKSRKDVEFLWNNLEQIDIIESDHAPHTKEEKENPPAGGPPFGVPGLETTLPLLLTAVSDGKMEVQDIIRLCHDNPKRIFKLPDQNATVEVDENEKYIFKNAELFTKCGWSPFNEREMKGRIKKVTVRGKTLFENGKITAAPGSGRVIQPAV